MVLLKSGLQHFNPELYRTPNHQLHRTSAVELVVRLSREIS